MSVWDGIRKVGLIPGLDNFPLVTELTRDVGGGGHVPGLTESMAFRHQLN